MNPLRNGYKEAARIAKGSGSSFPATFWLLPPEKRRGMNAIYAFCRLLDDAVDEPGTIEEKKSRLDSLRSSFKELSVHHRYSNDFFAALDHTMQRFSLPTAPFEELFDGMASDIGTEIRIATEKELWQYCDRVAGTVGRLVVTLCGVPEQAGYEYAVSTGRGLQLTNIIRDFRLDFAKTNRIYFPENWMREFSVSESDLLVTPTPPSVRELLRYTGQQCELAYRKAGELRPEHYKSETRFAEALRGVYFNLFQRMQERDFNPDIPLKSTRFQKLIAGWNGFWK